MVIQFFAFKLYFQTKNLTDVNTTLHWGPRWLSGRALDSRARGPGFKPLDRNIVSLSKTFEGSQSTGIYPGGSGSVPKWLKNG